MSNVFLECKTFFDEFPELAYKSKCCENCHKERRRLIFVRPYAAGVYCDNTDWNLCVEAIVCCGIYDFVRAIPREWWVAKAKQYGVGRDDGRGYIHPDSPHRDTDRPRNSPAVSRSVDRAAKRKVEEDEPEGFRSWLGRK